MVLCGDDDVGMISDQMGFDIDILRRTTHDCEIKIVTVDFLANFLAVSDRQFDADIGMVFRECRDGVRYDMSGPQD